MAESDWNAYKRYEESAKGSSPEFYAWLHIHHPGLLVNERDITLCEHGTLGWTPEDEIPPPPGVECNRCHGSIKPGSRRYCAKCGCSGFDRKLEIQRRLAGTPRPDPKPDDRPDGQKGGRS